jgi:mRNA interferase RelE/StbE
MYTVTIVRPARKQLARLPAADLARIRPAIDALAANPRPPGCVKLTGSAYWRIRIGVYRVLYTIDDDQQVVRVAEVGHRRDVYR